MTSAKVSIRAADEAFKRSKKASAAGDKARSKRELRAALDAIEEALGQISVMLDHEIAKES